MASDTSGKAKLGTAIALLGGAVGTGIVIYALMGDRMTAPLVADKTSDAAAPDPQSDVSDTGSLSDANEAAETSKVDTSDVATTESQSDAPPAPSEDNTEAAATPSQIEPAATDETAPNTADATQETVDEAPAEPQTEVAGVTQPRAETEPKVEGEPQPEATDPATSEPDSSGTTDAPIVETDDPVMPAAEPVVLQAAPAPTGQGPALDPSDPAVPKFDLVRIEADGSAVIAGRASPNAEVHILSNGEEIGTATASSRGEFVALIDTEVTTTAQSLALVADAPDTGRVSSQSNVIVLARNASEIDNLDEEISLAPAIVQATPDAVRVIQPVVGLADLDRVSLDTISYDNAGQVILAGRGRPGFTARVYADGKSLSDSKISGSGTWSATINDLDAGRYVIRVDELNPQGDVASRVESPFQRIFPTAEQLALLTDATSVIVQPGNNLWTIAEGRYGEGFRYTTIFEANKEQIRDPDLIYPGQVFELP